MSHLAASAILAAVGVAALAGCGSSTSSAPEAGIGAELDAAPGPGLDTGSHPGADVGPASGFDAGPHLGTDAGAEPGFDSGPGVDAGPEAGLDAGVETSPDAMVCPAGLAPHPGGQCDSDDDCGTNGLCLRGADSPMTFPPEGFCLRDDGVGATCSTDADCGEHATCIDTDGYRWCLPKCGCTGSDATTCPARQACFTIFNGLTLDQPSCVPGKADAADGDGCAGVYECNSNSQCHNDIEHPGGSCEALGCTTPGSGDGCHGGTCVAIFNPPFNGNLCMDTCTTDADCREAEAYSCFDAGSGTKYCRHPHVGDACANAGECGGGAWECHTADGFLGGYCTQTGCPTPGSNEGCTAGSVCGPVGSTNGCLDRCAAIGSQSNCRIGYFCSDVHPSPSVSLGACTPM